MATSCGVSRVIGSRVSPSFAVACPQCHAQVNEPCVYTWPAGVDPDFAHFLTRQEAARVARVGQITKQPHYQRIRALASSQEAAEQRTVRRPANFGARGVAACETEWDRRERLRLRAWLVRYADVLIRSDG